MLNKKNLLPILTSLAVVVIALVTFLGYKSYINSKVEKGFKEITVTVIVKTDSKNHEKTYKYWTEADFLGDALDEKNLIETQASAFGKFVIGVDGITADSEKQEWWNIKLNDVDLATGVYDQAIKHEDKIILELKIGW